MGLRGEVVTDDGRSGFTKLVSICSLKISQLALMKLLYDLLEVIGSLHSLSISTIIGR